MILLVVLFLIFVSGCSSLFVSDQSPQHIKVREFDDSNLYKKMEVFTDTPINPKNTIVLIPLFQDLQQGTIIATTIAKAFSDVGVESEIYFTHAISQSDEEIDEKTVDVLSTKILEGIEENKQVLWFAYSLGSSDFYHFDKVEVFIPDLLNSGKDVLSYTFAGDHEIDTQELFSSISKEIVKALFL